MIVLGGGTAGVHAALAVASTGMTVALFDENAAVAMQASLPVGSVTSFLAHVVWSVSGEFCVDAVGPEGAVRCMARALIVASGATERMVPFDGCTLPGVLSLTDAAKTLASHGRLPGRSLIVGGCGPLLAAVAAQMIESGGRVEAIVDLAGAAEWTRALPVLAASPARFVERLGWLRTIRRAGTPRLRRCAVVRAERAGEGLRATLARCDAAGRAIDMPCIGVAADLIAIGNGFTPNTEVIGLLRAHRRYIREAEAWMAEADEHGRTSRALLYVAGAAAGTVGVDAAATHGTLVGLTSAFDLSVSKRTPLRRRMQSARRRHHRNTSLGRAMTRLMMLGAQIDGIPPAAIVCRCEGVKRAEIDDACDAGAHDMNQLKAWTRCGMGSCQGRMCGDVAAELLMRRLGTPSRETVGFFTSRTPLRPVPVEALTGDFQYGDIDIPNAAPL